MQHGSVGSSLKVWRRCMQLIIGIGPERTARPKSGLTILAAGAGVLLAVTPLLAHHSFAAEYDNTKRVTLQGKFTKMDWVNPHSWIHMEAVNPASGKVETWD